MTDTVRLSLAEAEALCVRAAMGVGASEEAAHALARAAVAAEAEGQPNVGLAHMVDYVEAMVSQVAWTAARSRSSPGPRRR